MNGQLESFFYFTWGKERRIFSIVGAEKVVTTRCLDSGDLIRLNYGREELIRLRSRYISHNIEHLITKGLIQVKFSEEGKLHVLSRPYQLHATQLINQ